MIYITGDTHRRIERFSPSLLPGESEWTENDYLIVYGDFGFIFENDEKEKRWLDELSLKPYKILWVDGNHENFAALKEEGRLHLGINRLKTHL